MYAALVCRDPQTNELSGMMVLHVDDSCYAGHGAHYEKCCAAMFKNMDLGKTKDGFEGFE